MYCPACGAERPAEARFCPGCGTPLAPTPPPPTQTYDATAEMAGVLPVNTSVMAIVAGYAGLVAPLLLVTAPVGVVCGILGLRELRKRPGVRGHVRCWVGILVGALVMLLVGTAVLITILEP